jgi:hypothetical protein
MPRITGLPEVDVNQFFSLAFSDRSWALDLQDRLLSCRASTAWIKPVLSGTYQNCALMSLTMSADRLNVCAGAYRAS